METYTGGLAEQQTIKHYYAGTMDKPKKKKKKCKKKKKST
jgi:hypothetical protein